MKSHADGVEKSWSAQEQCRAVLCVWTERRSVEALCRELKISRATIMQWQERAMCGMMRALSPRELQEERKPALAVMVRRLVERHAAEQSGTPLRLARRLAAVAKGRDNPAAPAEAPR